MKPMIKEFYMPGDVVTYKGINRIVLNKVEVDDRSTLYHIFHPERGVYTVDGDELEYIAHLTEMDIMLERLDKIKTDKKSA